MEFRFPTDRTLIICEGGQNHQGDIGICKQLIDVAADAKADVFKLQVKTPHMSLPPELWNVERDTPWGTMKYIDYRKRMEFSVPELQEIVAHCKKRNILFSASAWDLTAADKLFHLGASLIKIASASVTNLELISHIAKFKLPVVMSTGMSSLADIRDAIKALHPSVPDLALLVCTSTYPAKPEDLNLNRILALRHLYPEYTIGYSGHEVGLWTTLCAVAMGAKIVERHITLDHTMKGSDHAASIEPHAIKRLVYAIRNFEKARGSGEIRVLDCERDQIDRLRGKVNRDTGATQECPESLQ